MPLEEINFDGIIGPSHNYAGLSHGNLAATANKGLVSYPRAAALQGVLKMRHNIGLGLRQGVLLPHTRPNRDWLTRLALRYDASPSDPVGLLSRVDIVPPSLALAQAGEESGWGASRSARLGNAMFGQATWDGAGPPIGEAVNGRVPRLRVFERLSEGAEAYVRNLNTNRAYESFRAVRAAERRAGRPLDGARLATGLMRYSERGQAYIDTIRTHIRANQLHRLDDARLHDRWG